MVSVLLFLFHCSGDDESRGGVKILSFPDYCRYKTVLKRLQSFPDGWLNDALVRALGGFTVPHRGTRLMYCKEEFEHPELAYHEKLCDHLGKLYLLLKMHITYVIQHNESRILGLWVFLNIDENIQKIIKKNNKNFWFFFSRKIWTLWINFSKWGIISKLRKFVKHQIRNSKLTHLQSSPFWCAASHVS